MGANTKIQWTDFTFNPWIGCTKVHAGCTNCYAEDQNKRWAYNGGTWGKGTPRKVTSAANWKQPLKWARDAAKAGERRRVFCASLADVLDEEAPPEAQQALWELIRATAFHCCDACPKCGGEPPTCGGLDWLLLTKRPERWELVPEDVRPLVWLGTSIADQKTADEWVPRLMAAGKPTEFAVRFVSLEPQIGPVDLAPWLDADWDLGGVALDWVIVGGESGPRARPFDIGWARSVVSQCHKAGVPCFVKQLGAVSIDSETGTDCRNDWDSPIRDPKGGDWDEWPARLRVRQFPEVSRG